MCTRMCHTAMAPCYYTSTCPRSFTNSLRPSGWLREKQSPPIGYHVCIMQIQILLLTTTLLLLLLLNIIKIQILIIINTIIPGILGQQVLHALARPGTLRLVSSHRKRIFIALGVPVVVLRVVAVELGRGACGIMPDRLYTHAYTSNI